MNCQVCNIRKIKENLNRIIDKVIKMAKTNIEFQYYLWGGAVAFFSTLFFIPCDFVSKVIRLSSSPLFSSICWNVKIMIGIMLVFSVIPPIRLFLIAQGKLEFDEKPYVKTSQTVTDFLKLIAHHLILVSIWSGLVYIIFKTEHYSFKISIVLGSGIALCIFLILRRYLLEKYDWDNIVMPIRKD